MNNSEGLTKLQIWEEIRNQSNNYQRKLQPLFRKQMGIYYTELDLADFMVSDMFIRFDDAFLSELTMKKFLEPCVGIGNFVFAYLKKIDSLMMYSKEDIVKIINNIYVSDVDEEALEIYFDLLGQFCKVYFDIDVSLEYKKTNISNGLVFNLLDDETKYISIESMVGKYLKFDIVITNPPYKNLKAENNHYNTEEQFLKDKDKYNKISKFVKKRYFYCTAGTVNLYKLFVEEILCNYTTENAVISLLIPSAILTDKSCFELRTFILLKNNLQSICTISENSNFIDAKQGLAALLIKKGEETKRISLIKDYNQNADPKPTLIDVEDIIDKNTGNAIVALNEDDYYIIKKMKMHPKLGDLRCIVNLRGELDVTLNKSFITKEKSNYVLYRGRNIQPYSIKPSEEFEYVSDSFMESTKKAQYVFGKRLACQQIVNINKARRLTFSLVEENKVLANSCNFITVMKNEHNIDLYYILGLMNSEVMNWYFKIFSSNNHVNNYEINMFPIPVNNTELMGLISCYVQEYLLTGQEFLIDEIDFLVRELFEVNELEMAPSLGDNFSIKEKKKSLTSDLKHFYPDFSEFDVEQLNLEKIDVEYMCIKYGLNNKDKKVFQSIYTKHKLLAKNVVLNHTSFKLSDLDLEMIRNVPQGGSWKDIPHEVVEKSKRLLNITKTGGRTTLYGRIDYNKPCYTITTYFSRPGNGTYVHPIYDRVLSVREAARVQGFPDDYYFFGNKNQILNQIGNAVPPVMAYQIGKSIFDKTGFNKSVDLFCGAGGFTSGFSAAGIHSVISNDIEESACITLKSNHPEIETYCADICDENTKDYIVRRAIESGAEIVCGGPPCQGFSMAGFRDETDPRNQLFRDFIDVVNRVEPKVIVFENVQGIMTLKKGAIYKEILQLFNEIGYNLEARLLNFVNYGVPQKRKRVVIIGVRKDQNVIPSELFPNEITLFEDQQITARETFYDLEDVELDKNRPYKKDGKVSSYVRLLKGEIDYEEYFDYFSNEIKVKDQNVSSYEQLSLI